MIEKKKCLRCGLVVCSPCFPVKLGAAGRQVVVASDSELSRISHFHRLAIATRSLNRPRRKIPDWIADTIYQFEGSVVWPNGDQFVMSDTAIDDAFNDDGSFRWFTDFIQRADILPRQRPQARVIARLRLIDLAFRIAYPARARLIAK